MGIIQIAMIGIGAVALALMVKQQKSEYALYLSLSAVVLILVFSMNRLQVVMETIRKMRRCLEEFALEGFATNAELSYQILYHPTFIRGGCTTAFLDENLPSLLEFSRRLSESEAQA